MQQAPPAAGTIPRSLPRFSSRRVRVAALLAAAVVSSPASICAGQSLLSGPQKIVIDEAHNRLLVSNYNTGSLVAIDSAGNQTYFVQSAGLIDGMEIVGNTVYGVASARRIKGFDLDSGSLVETFTLAGTTYLSSVVADRSGNLYISCPLRNEIYRLRLSDGAYWTFVGGSSLNKPNGMIFEEAENRLVVIEDRPNPRILAVSLADSTVTTLAATTLSGGDGIARDAAGYYYITGYYLPAIYRLEPDFGGTPTVIYSGSGIVYPTYDARDNSLLVTCYSSNGWLRIYLDPAGLPATQRSEILQVQPGCPNPFRPATTVRFHLALPGRVRIDVHGVCGERVRTLMDGVSAAGDRFVTWDGRDDAGAEVAAGAYFIRVDAGGREETRRVVRIR